MKESNVLRAGSLVTLLLLCPHRAESQTVIEGKVDLPKPEATTAAPPRYAGQVGAIASPDPPVAIVYLEGQFPAALTNSPPGTNHVRLRQHGMQFRPGVLPIRVGTTVAFPNEDDFYHNVFSYSKPKRFDLGRYRKEDPPPVRLFDKPGLVKLYCEIHQHMRGFILVLDTPYFTRTGINGVYRLENLPAGNYTLKVWVDETRTYERPVELANGRTLHADFPVK